MKTNRLHPAAECVADGRIESAEAEEQRLFLETFRQDVLKGLSNQPKSIPCKYLYDERGCELFDQICQLPEYYPTRTELGILGSCLDEISRLCGPGVEVIEYGSGSGLKTQMLLSALVRPTGCTLIEISRCYLDQCAAELAQEFPQISVTAVCADFTRPLQLAGPPAGMVRRLAFFPGSTIGNLDPEEAKEFLAGVARAVGPGGAMVIGVDLQKDEAILCPAYDDTRGVTAAFNLNLLSRISRELDLEISPDDFYHAAPYNGRLGRMEMHLVARRGFSVVAAEGVIHFEQGESIHTESSYKYTLDGFASMAEDAGWKIERVWTDSQELFSVQFMRHGGQLEESPVNGERRADNG